MNLFVQTVGSVMAILALTGVAWWLHRGNAPFLDSEEAVKRAANEVEDGFLPVACACDAEGVAALARDGAGQIMVIRRHGNRFAGRILGASAKADMMMHELGFALIVDPGEAYFGEVSLAIAEAQAWADAINQVNRPEDA